MLAARPPTRLDAIARARAAVIDEGHEGAVPWVAPWIASSWQRCIALGHRPQQRVGFDVITAAAVRRTLDASAALRRAAAPVLDDLARTIAPTRYFSVLTDAAGIVVALGGAPDRADRRVGAIARVGVDLSEPSVGTTAIGAALGEQQPVWLHRGEHFFDDTAVYSCAGAPIAGPDGRCVGMLDLTGVEADERPELRHLAARMAQRIESALLLAQPRALLLGLQWPGAAADEAVGWLAIDADGAVAGADRIARAMLALPAGGKPQLDELFATPMSRLFDLHRGAAPVLLPLWSGVTLQAQVGDGRHDDTAPRLRESASALIAQAVRAAQGNVALAARRLGVSRATVYRHLARARTRRSAG